MNPGISATLELNLKKIIAEVKETAQAMIDFADELEEIDRKYSDKSEMMHNDD